MKRKKQRILCFGLGIGLFTATAVLAGASFNLTCTNTTCDYKGNVRFGGGIGHQRITGYCAHDKAFVYLTWKRAEKAPESLKVWNAQTGQFLDLYYCPQCTRPFLPIESNKSLKHCPQCNQPTLKHEVSRFYD